MKRHLFKLALFLILGAIVNVTVAWGCANWHGDNKTLEVLFSAMFSAADFDKVREEVNDNNFPKNSYISLELEEQWDGLSVISFETHSYASGEYWVKLREERPDQHLTDSEVQNYVHGGYWGYLQKAKPDTHLIAAKIIRTGNVQRIIFTGMVGSPKPYKLRSGSWTSFEGRLDWAHIAVGFPLKSLSYTPSSSDEPSPADRQTKAWYLPNKFDKLFPSINELILPYGLIWPSFVINTFFYATILWLVTLAPFTARRMIRHKRGLCLKCGYDLNHAEHEICPECGYELCKKAIE